MLFGELKKLTIEGFNKAERNDPAMKKYEVMFNPTNFSRRYGSSYNDPEGQGSTSSKRVFNKVKSQTYSFDFLIDGTGTAGAGLANLLPIKRDVSEEVDKFLEVCGKADGEIHRPLFLKISWGKFVLKCQLDSADVTYTLFKPDGTPLRAKIKASFSEAISDELQAKKNGFNSPDLTHVRIIKEGDTLPLMASRIYGNSSFYLEVARVNDLTDFRNLTVGNELIFPPINDNPK